MSAEFDVKVATEALLQQTINHRDAGIFQAHLNERVGCNVRAAFLGRPSADALIKAASHMSRYVEPRAPTELTEPAVDTLKTHPYIVKLRQLRDSLSQAPRDGCGTMAKATGIETYEMYQKGRDALPCAKTKLWKSALKESREHVFNNIETKEINDQLDGSLYDAD
jgi:hypothetical protein